MEEVWMMEVRKGRMLAYRFDFSILILKCLDYWYSAIIYLGDVKIIAELGTSVLYLSLSVLQRWFRSTYDTNLHTFNELQMPKQKQ